MDKFQVDQLARALGAGHSRRAVLKSAAGGGVAGALALLAARGAEAAQGEGGPPIDSTKLAQLEAMAAITAAAISLIDDPNNPKNGKIKLHDERLSGLDKEQAKLVKRMVSDINKKKIGFAFFPDETSLKLYGSERALDRGEGPESAQDLATTGHTPRGSGAATNGIAAPSVGHGISPNSAATAGSLAAMGAASTVAGLNALNAVWADWWGVHIYLDPWWTARLWEQAGWAIGAIIGLSVAALCNTGVACLAAGLIASWVWEFLVWGIIRPMGPHDLIIHAPWWGYVHVQPRRSGTWYNNRWFRSGLWT